MRTRVLPILLALWTRVSRAEIYFVNPPQFGITGDFSSNAVYTVGQNLRVQWSDAPDNTGISVLLYQLNGTQYMLPGQYLFRTNFPLIVGIMLHYWRLPSVVCIADTSFPENVVNTTVYDWTVAVSDNLPATLAESNLFYLSVFQEGKTSSDSNSHYFNITEAKSTSTSSSTTTSSASTTLSTSTQMASSVTPASTTSTSTASASTSSQPSSSDTNLSTGAKIGIGVGIPAAAIIGIGAGWFFFGRRRRQQTNAPGAGADPRYSDPSMGPNQQAGSRAVSEYWAPNHFNGGELYSKQAEPLRQQYSPPVFEASGESRVTQPAELYTDTPHQR
ncbi:hypothetical protein J7T55_005581 [Diaporthe amygdali]|uniref:uncharacterized protein n=1 Tax=Phomopsis amygdali TaxID=1214568 RepID=UPI0022FEED84|nr:uncharacterized protein J7T55_005581 [Diaporthe amygdali]KAJ0124243.1 hypothetical protein J7T55_005581 [Diaporthe amygdali]